MTHPIITLTTDFGIADTYDGVMKGVILSVCPEARIVDLTHDIPPQNVLAGAIALETVLGYFPNGTIHVAVVDPGVGSERVAVAIETDHSIFVGPDNGLFTLVLQRESLRRAVALTNPEYHRQPVSATFHGRDIFAPVAAHLANGVPIDELGESVEDLSALMISTPIVKPERIEAHVMHADRFGNLITDLTLAAYNSWLAREPGSRALIDVGGNQIDGLRRTFTDVGVGEPVVYPGSAGRLEVAVSNGSAAEFLDIDLGDAIHIRRV